MCNCGQLTSSHFIIYEYIYIKNNNHIVSTSILRTTITFKYIYIENNNHIVSASILRKNNHIAGCSRVVAACYK